MFFPKMEFSLTLQRQKKYDAGLNQLHVLMHVQIFLGLCNYYRRFIRNFAKIAKPLTHLMEKNIVYKWTEECQTSFDLLQNRLVNSPILAFPDAAKQYVLDTNQMPVIPTLVQC